MLRKFFKRCAWLCLLAALMPQAWAFSLEGDGAFGSDSFETSGFAYGSSPGGYSLCGGGYGYVGGFPRQLQEGYRWNMPVFYYAADQTFLDYFGTNGLRAIDQAFLVLSNALSWRPMTSLSSNLTEFPLNSARYNYRAQALKLGDLKTFTASMMLDRLGLADPVVWTWSLREKNLISTRTCPDYVYTVIQRNYDPIQLASSSVVNGTLYTYHIETCPDCSVADAIEDLVDPTRPGNLPMASYASFFGERAGFGQYGLILSSLTRDDMGGFRWLLSTNRLNVESIEPTSTLISGGFTNRSVTQSVTTADLAALASQALTNPPGVLQALYPGLLIGSSTNFLVAQVTTNAGSTVVGGTNIFSSSPVLPSGVSAVTNFAPNQILSTFDLALFAQQALTNDSVGLLALYPNLSIANSTNYFVNAVTTNFSYGFTNFAGSSLTVTNFADNQLLTTFDLALLAQQALTNPPAALQALYPTLAINNSTNYFTNIVTTNITATILQTTNGASQIVTNTSVAFPISTLDLSAFASASLTNNAAALTALYPGLIVTSEAIQWVIATNVTVTPYFYLPPYATAASIPSVGYNYSYFYTYVPNYIHTFGNVVTNFATNRMAVSTVTVRDSAPWAVAGTVAVTTTVQTIITNSISGDFYLLPPTNCAYKVISSLSNIIPTTNFVASASTNNGNFVSISTVTYFTNHQLLVEPVTCTGFSTNYTTNIVTNYRHSFGNVITNTYYPNSTVTVLTTNIFNCGPSGVSGQLCTNYSVANVTTNMLAGDFYIVPTNLCGYDIQAMQLSVVTAATNIQSIVTNSDGSTLTTALGTYFTNHTFVVRPITCLGIQTNFTTNIVVNYQYSFNNVVTNHVYTNSPLTVLNTSIGPCPGSIAGILCTNSTLTNATATNVLGGDFYIIPSALCGVSIIGTQLVNTIATTNVLLTATNSNGSTYTRSGVTYFTNYNLVVDSITCLAGATNYTTNIVTQYAYTFDNVVTNHIYSNAPVTLLITNVGPCSGGVGGTYCTNVTTTNVVLTNVVSGDFYLLPASQCGLSITGVQLTNTVSATNFQSVVTNGNGSVVSQAVVTYATNYTLFINPVDCQAPGYSSGAVLRQGIDRLFFIRRDFDSLIGQFFAPVTTNYMINAVYNNQIVPQKFRRTVNQPDILFSAVDTGVNGFNNGVEMTYSGPQFYTGDALPNLAGPGTMRGQMRFSFDKIPLRLFNYNNGFVSFLDQATASTNFMWASFDASTNAPIVYPVGTDISNLESAALMNIVTAALPDATSGAPYAPVTLAGTGGISPYSWSVFVNSPSGLPAGLTLSPGGIISGTPLLSSVGVYDITIQMTDSGGRSVLRDYILTVH